MRDALTAVGYAPLVTGGDADLSHIIRTEKPHLVLLDLMLPGTDGIVLMESVPDLPQQHLVGRDPSRVEREHSQQLVFGRRQRHLTRAHRYPALLVVDGQLSQRERLRLCMPAQCRPLPGRELRARERLDDVVVGAALQRPCDGLVASIAGDEHDRQLGELWGERAAGDMDLVRNFVKKLRAKLGEDAAQPTWIFNERGVGYRMPRPG